MPIEIKELIIKVQIEASTSATAISESVIDAKLQEFKSQLIHSCVEKVLEKIKEKNER